MPSYYEISVNSFPSSRWHRAILRLVSNTLQRTENPIVDVGCGDGYRVTVGLRSAGEVIGVDTDLEMLRHAERRLPAVVHASAEALPFRENCFHSALCMEVLEHVPKPQAVIRQLAQVVTTKGKLLIVVPQETILFRVIWFLWTRLTEGRRWRNKHINHLKPMDLTQILHENSFKTNINTKTNLGMIAAILSEKVADLTV